MNCSSQSSSPSQSVSTPRSVGRAAGVQPAAVRERQLVGLKSAPSAAKCTSTPSLKPSPSVSACCGSVPLAATSSSSVRPSPSVSAASMRAARRRGEVGGHQLLHDEGAAHLAEAEVQEVDGLVVAEVAEVAAAQLRPSSPAAPRPG